MRSFRSGAALLAVVAVLVAGCAKDGVEPQRWAGRVCEALKPWTREISSLTRDTQRQMSKATTPGQAKQNLVALLRGAEDASEDARRGVRAAGVPAVDNGQQIADRFLAALQAARDAYAKARKRVERLAVDDTDSFYDGVVAAMDSLSDDYNAGALDTDKLSSEELQQAFDTAPNVRADRMLEQLSLFDADVVPAAPEDLEGLLAGPGQVVRLGGTARVSVVVEDRWRADALLAEFAARGVVENPEPTAVIGPRGVLGARVPGARGVPGAQGVPGARGAAQAGAEPAAVEGHIGVRTAFSAALAPIAARWLHGATTRPPVDFQLDGPRLRLWFVAAGRALGPPGRPSQGVVLRLSAGEEAAWPTVRRALARLGLPAALLGLRAGGPAFRIVGRRRVAHFVELIGGPGAGVPVEVWPRTVSGRAQPGSVLHSTRLLRTT